LNFEKSKEFYELVQSFEKIFSYMETKFSNKEKSLAHKHIWISYKKYLFLFNEMNNTTKKKEFFITHNPIKYFESYYRGHVCPQVIITNFEIENKKDFETFLQKWHKKSFPISISTNPNDGHFQNLLELAKIHATQELEKSSTLGLEIKKLLKLPFEPKTIDCFDVSHKQGHFMVGSCIRFKNGEPDKENFRKFKIKTVKTQDDYKCLQEIVQRRYRDIKDLPDLILIDGGKGQLNAVNNIFPKTEFASLAKREETIYSKRILNGKKLNLKNFSGQSIISLRDYAHHFAISYHKIICQKSIIELI
jgi:excinuclease ABC subunit C